MLNELSWIDFTSLGILSIFGILGLFRGFLWQASRLLSLLLGYVFASIFAEGFASWLTTKLSIQNERIAVYLAFFLIFVAVLILLSLVTMVLQRFIKQLELSFYDHLGGGLLGVLTGGALMIAALGLVFWAFPKTDLVVEARESSTGIVARRIVGTFSDLIPPQISELYGVSSKSKKEGAKEEAQENSRRKRTDASTPASPIKAPGRPGKKQAHQKKE